MKKTYLALALNAALAAAFVTVSMPAKAQDAQSPQESQTQSDTQPAAGRHQQRSPEQVVQFMTTKLNLTEDQQKQILPIIADRQQKMRDLRSEGGRRRKKMREAKSIMQDSDKKINDILNDQQKQQYAELKKEMRDHMRERRQNQGMANPQ